MEECSTMDNHEKSLLSAIADHPREMEDGAFRNVLGAQTVKDSKNNGESIDDHPEASVDRLTSSSTTTIIPDDQQQTIKTAEGVFMHIHTPATLPALPKSSILFPAGCSRVTSANSTRIQLPALSTSAKSHPPFAEEVFVFENGAESDLMDIDWIGPPCSESQKPRWLSSLHSVIFIITCALAVFIVFRNVLTW